MEEKINGDEIAKKTTNIIIQVLAFIVSITISIIKGIYDALNELTNDWVNTILYYILGIAVSLNFILLPFTIFQIVNLSSSVVALTLVLIFLLAVIYRLFRLIEEYRFNRRGEIDKNKINFLRLTAKVYLIVIIISAIVAIVNFYIS